MIDARQHVVNPSGRYQVPPADRIGHGIHHSVTTISEDATEAEEIAHIKAIDSYHNSLGWGGFGYHTATFPSGRSYQIGDWDGARAHVASRNHELVGSVAIGDFRDSPPSEATLRGLAECVKAAREHFGRELPVKRHRDWALPQYPTECPALIEIDDVLHYVMEEFMPSEQEWNEMKANMELLMQFRLDQMAFNTETDKQADDNTKAIQAIAEQMRRGGLTIAGEANGQ